MTCHALPLNIMSITCGRTEVSLQPRNSRTERRAIVNVYQSHVQKLSNEVTQQLALTKIARIEMTMHETRRGEALYRRPIAYRDRCVFTPPVVHVGF